MYNLICRNSIQNFITIFLLVFVNRVQAIETNILRTSRFPASLNQCINLFTFLKKGDPRELVTDIQKSSRYEKDYAREFHIGNPLNTDFGALEILKRYQQPLRNRDVIKGVLFFQFLHGRRNLGVLPENILNKFFEWAIHHAKEDALRNQTDLNSDQKEVLENVNIVESKDGLSEGKLGVFYYTRHSHSVFKMNELIKILWQGLRPYLTPILSNSNDRYSGLENLYDVMKSQLEDVFYEDFKRAHQAVRLPLERELNAYDRFLFKISNHFFGGKLEQLINELEVIDPQIRSQFERIEEIYLKDIQRELRDSSSIQMEGGVQEEASRRRRNIRESSDAQSTAVQVGNVKADSAPKNPSSSESENNKNKRHRPRKTTWEPENDYWPTHSEDFPGGSRFDGLPRVVKELIDRHFSREGPEYYDDPQAP